MASDSTPIVSRLKLNLAWMAWLKPLFIHPSVTAGARDNKAFILTKMSTLYGDLNESRVRELRTQLMNEDPSFESLSARELISFRRGGEFQTYQVSGGIKYFNAAWREVNKRQNAAVRKKLRTLFKTMKFRELSLMIDLANLMDDAGQGSGLNAFLSTHGTEFDEDSLKQIEPLALATNNSKIIRAYHRFEKAVKNPETSIFDISDEAVDPYISPSHILQGAFLKTYGLDGLETLK